MGWFKYEYTNVCIGGNNISFDLEINEPEDLIVGGLCELQKQLAVRYYLNLYTDESFQEYLIRECVSLNKEYDIRVLKGMEDFHLIDIVYPLEYIKRMFNLVHIFITSSCEACRAGWMGQDQHMQIGGCLYVSPPNE